MQVRELAIPGVFEFTPPSFGDRRGVFVAPYQEATFTKTVGHSLRVAQTNHSVSARGVIRGVHFTDTPPGQAKYVHCPRGELLDIIIDLRVGSPTFGRWDAVRLDGATCNSIYIPEGLGHGFVALADDTVTSYLCSSAYDPTGEHGINPLDPELGLPWPEDLDPVLSDKDRAAPTLAEALAADLLPRYEDCLAWYEKLRTSG